MKGNSNLYNELVLAGNNAFLNSMKEFKDWFNDKTIPCYISYEDKAVWKQYDIFSFDKFLSLSYQKVVRKIRDPRTFGIVVFNYDLYGISNYIEPSTFAQIAIAITQGKKVYLVSDYPEIYEKELKNWKCKVINGDINKVYKDLEDKIFFDNQQLSLFD